MTRRKSRRILTDAPALDATRTGRGAAVLVLVLVIVGCTAILSQQGSPPEATPTPAASFGSAASLGPQGASGIP